MRRNPDHPLAAADNACSSRREACRQSSIAHTRSSSRNEAVFALAAEAHKIMTKESLEWSGVIQVDDLEVVI